MIFSLDCCNPASSATGTSSSHVLGMSAMGIIHVAVNMTPFPEYLEKMYKIRGEFSEVIQMARRHEPLSYPLIAPQLHATNPPIYPRNGMSRWRKNIAGRSCGGINLTGRCPMSHFSAVVIIAARLAASS